MHRITLLTTFALCVVSAVAGGAVVRLIGLAGTPDAMATVLFVGGVLAVGLGGGLVSRPTGRTRYWR